MFHVVFQDQSIGLIECCLGRTDLNQNLFAIPSLLDHCSYAFDLALDPDQAVDDAFVQVSV